MFEIIHFQPPIQIRTYLGTYLPTYVYCVLRMGEHPAQPSHRTFQVRINLVFLHQELEQYLNSFIQRYINSYAVCDSPPSFYLQ